MTWPSAEFELFEMSEEVTRPDPFFNHDAERVINYLRWLVESIGARGSCGKGEREAAEYAAAQLRGFGLQDVHLEGFQGAASAYRRYALICGLALAATVAAVTLTAPPLNGLAFLVHLAAAQAMLFESDFRSNWSRVFLPGRESQNVVSRQPAALRAERSIVLVAHLDTARTPAFNASRRGQRAYNLLFRGLFFSLLGAGLLHAALALGASPGLTWGLVATAALQAITLALFFSADRTPYSPGAYDNASGVACVLALAERLRSSPLRRSEVWCCLTGCEETGTAGAIALYNQHTANWQRPTIINLDQLGYSRIYLRIREGLLRRYAARDACIRIANQAAATSPGVDFMLRPSQAFSDATPAYQRNLLAISLGSTPADRLTQTHRHRLSDTTEHLSPEGFAGNLCYIWSLLNVLDHEPLGQAHE
jgi:hypothetical protein